jgi:hypothetical protein
MYCPQCGQQQIADSTRFCSRCGLLVSGLAEWLARGGVVPAVHEKETVRRPTSPKRKGIRRGAILMFISAVLLIPFFAMAVVSDSPGPLVIPFTVFFAGLSILLYSVIFGDDVPVPTGQPSEPSRLATMFRGNALPPATHNPIQNVIEHPVRTSELVEPPSVTENTTKLLDRD